MTKKQYGTVMAVFCDSQLDVVVFENALKLAREHGARLILLDVRHQHAASQLGDLLSTHGMLGRRTVERLEREVKDRRSEVIRRMLDEMKLRAESEGLEVTVLEKKGDFDESVAAAVAETGAKALVIERSHHEDLEGGFDVVRV